MFCFAERPRDLFTEAAAHGWLAAIRDFPRLKNRDECEAAAQIIPDEMRAEVCCIEDEYSYRLLIVTGWVISYQACVRDVSDREKALSVVALKAMPDGEALALVRHGFSEGEAQAAISEAYTAFTMRA